MNANGLIIAINEGHLTKGFKQSYELIHTHFKYPRFHNGIIAFYLLFATDHWPSDEQDDLDELQRIRNINSLAKDLINLGCDQEFANLIGSNKLGQLVTTLQSMSKIKSSMPMLNQTMIMVSNEWLESKLDIHDEALIMVPAPLEYIQVYNISLQIFKRLLIDPVTA